MATRIASWAATHPLDWASVRETSAAWAEDDDADLRGRHRVAAAGVFLVSAVLFLTPPAVALLVLTGRIT